MTNCVLLMKFALLNLRFAFLVVLVIFDFMFFIAFIIFFTCQIIMCKLHFAISFDKISLNSFCFVVCIGFF